MDDVTVSRFEGILYRVDGGGWWWNDHSQSEYQAAKGPCSKQVTSRPLLGSKAGCCHSTIYAHGAVAWKEGHPGEEIRKKMYTLKSYGRCFER